jgi:hypothetical protein
VITVIEYVVNNWYILVGAIIVLAVVTYFVVAFLRRPTSEKLNKVTEWLLFAVTEAEKKLGSGTGQIKLRYVYDMFLVKFPYLAKVVSFERFSVLVDEALVKFREILATNKSIKEYVEKETTEK